MGSRPQPPGRNYRKTTTTWRGHSEGNSEDEHVMKYYIFFEVFYFKLHSQMDFLNVVIHNVFDAEIDVRVKKEMVNYFFETFQPYHFGTKSLPGNLEYHGKIGKRPPSPQKITKMMYEWLLWI